MTMNHTDPNVLTGMPVVGTDGDKLGKVDTVYLDTDTSEPQWVAIKSGLFGNHVSLVPLFQADFDGERLAVPYGKQQIKDAPHQDAGKELSPDDERGLYAHYNVDGGMQGGESMRGNGGDPAMTRSEERMNTGTETTRTGQPRLRKHVVTENQQIDVPVSHDANRGAATDGPGFSHQDREVTLTEQRPAVTENQTVNGDVRKENIELDDSGNSRTR